MSLTGQTDISNSIHLSSPTIEAALTGYRRNITSGVGPEWTRAHFHFGEVFSYSYLGRKSRRVHRSAHQKYAVSFYWQVEKKRVFYTMFSFTPAEGELPIARLLEKGHLEERPTEKEIEEFLRMAVELDGPPPKEMSMD